MNYFRTKAFLKLFQSLSSNRQERVTQALQKLHLLFQEKENPMGLGLKQLRHGIWEIRAGLADRILFQRKKDTVEFLIVGNHNEIKRYLKDL